MHKDVSVELSLIYLFVLNLLIKYVPTCILKYLGVKFDDVCNFQLFRGKCVCAYIYICLMIIYLLSIY